MAYSALSPEADAQVDAAFEIAGYMCESRSGEPERDYKKMGQAAFAVMSHHHVACNREELNQKAVAADELLPGVFADDVVEQAGVEEEAHHFLKTKVWGSVATAPTTTGQTLAETLGLVLCEAKVARTDDNGNTKLVRGRFLTDDEDLIMDFYVRPIGDTLVNAFVKSNKRAEVVLTRLPQLETKVARVLGSSVKQAVAQLTAAKVSAGSVRSLPAGDEPAA